MSEAEAESARRLCTVKRRTIPMLTLEFEMPVQEIARTARVEARIAPNALAVVRRAAELQGRSISDFLVAAALKDAHQTIEDAQIVRLSVDDQRRFAEMLLNPPLLAPAMKRALKARKKLLADV